MFEDLFSSIAICGCGLCCNNDKLCPSCEIATLKANGLPESCVSRISGLSRRGDYSPLYNGLRELRKEYHQNMTDQ